MKQVIFISGTGHCGSTLIDLVLGSNNKVRSLGELNSLMKNVPPYNKFWKPDLVDDLIKHYRFKSNRIVSFDYHRFPKSKLFEKRSGLYNKIFKNSREKILIDSSKDLFWIDRGYSHLNGSDIDPKILHVQRHPIAVVNSYRRKYPNKPFISIVRDIKKRTMDIERFLKKIPQEKILVVQYEDFCEYPKKNTKDICDFLQIDYSEDMLRYWETEHYILGGNSGTKFSITGNQNRMEGKRSDADYYKKNPRAIKLDERWKDELNSEQIKIFEEVFYKK